MSDASLEPFFLAYFHFAYHRRTTFAHSIDHFLLASSLSLCIHSRNRTCMYIWLAPRTRCDYLERMSMLSELR